MNTYLAKEEKRNLMHTYSESNKLNKKGNAFAWVSAIGTLFVLAIAYVVMTQPFEYIFSTTAAANFSGYTETRSLLQTTWQWFPAIILFGIVLWVLLQTLRRDTYGGYA